MPKPAKQQAKRTKPGFSPKIEKPLRQVLKILEQGHISSAIGPLRALAAQAPRDPRPWELLLNSFVSIGRYADAAEAGAKAAELAPDDPVVHASYAKALQKCGEYDRAILEYERAIYLDPEEPAHLHGKLAIYLDTAQNDKALAALTALERMIHDKGLDTRALKNIYIDKARLSPQHIDPAEVVKDLDPIAQDERTSPKYREIAYHHLGRLYEIMGEYDKAFDRYEASNRINKPHWDPDVFSAYVDKLLACWAQIEKIPPSTAEDGSRLIFITGMMRSGTSLTEQMIAQLPGVTPGGEMNAINHAVSSVEPVPHPMGQRPFPITRLSYTQKNINRMSRTAMQKYNEVAAEGFVTDKQPHNVFSIPAIRRMFPACKIINCRRDPLDNCLSNFVQSYARPHPHTYDLYWLGRFYRDYERMSEAFAACPVTDVYDLSYEALVEDPESETKKLCEHLGIPWSESVLAFHRSDRTVRTASRDQVRRPLYKSSVKKHEHYTHRLSDLYRGLGLEHPGTAPAPTGTDG